MISCGRIHYATTVLSEDNRSVLTKQNETSNYEKKD